MELWQWVQFFEWLFQLFRKVSEWTEQTSTICLGENLGVIVS